MFLALLQTRRVKRRCCATSNCLASFASSQPAICGPIRETLGRIHSLSPFLNLLSPPSHSRRARLCAARRRQRSAPEGGFGSLRRPGRLASRFAGRPGPCSPASSSPSFEAGVRTGPLLHQLEPEFQPRPPSGRYPLKRFSRMRHATLSFSGKNCAHPLERGKSLSFWMRNQPTLWSRHTLETRKMRIVKIILLLKRFSVRRGKFMAAERKRSPTGCRGQAGCAVKVPIVSDITAERPRLADPHNLESRGVQDQVALRQPLSGENRTRQTRLRAAIRIRDSGSSIDVERRAFAERHFHRRAERRQERYAGCPYRRRVFVEFPAVPVLQPYPSSRYERCCLPLGRHVDSRIINSGCTSNSSGKSAVPRIRCSRMRAASAPIR